MRSCEPLGGCVPQFENPWKHPWWSAFPLIQWHVSWRGEQISMNFPAKKQIFATFSTLPMGTLFREGGEEGLLLPELRSWVHDGFTWHWQPGPREGGGCYKKIWDFHKEGDKWLGLSEAVLGCFPHLGPNCEPATGEQLLPRADPLKSLELKYMLKTEHAFKGFAESGPC